MQTKTIAYFHDDTELEGFLAIDGQDNEDEKKPLVLVAHAWAGRSDFACQQAIKLAQMGYIGFALDMYGKGKLGQTDEECQALMMPIVSDRKKLQERMQLALTTALHHPRADVNRIGAIGFCFGGLCALDLARSGADIHAVVSFHGILKRPDFPNGDIKSKILALHGHDDPMVTPTDLIDFENEMTEQRVNWEVNTYGNTKHAFTNPLANNPSFGTVYHPEVAERAWSAMSHFFQFAFK